MTTGVTPGMNRCRYEAEFGLCGLDSDDVAELVREVEERESQGAHVVAVSPRLYEEPADNLDRLCRPKPKKRTTTRG